MSELQNITIEYLQTEIRDLQALAADRLEMNKDLEVAALKVLRTSLDRLELLRRCHDYLDDWFIWLETNTAKDNDDLMQLIDELAEELGDEAS